MSFKASLPRGTRDFLPESMVQREFIMETLKRSFRHFGFQSIETPAMEKKETLTGKYGEEGDRLIFKILPRGEKLDKVFKADSVAEAASSLNSKVEEALRYDLTVPFARFVVQNQNELDFPFKRYQIQPVWRADRPSKGRFREFYQCDADVVGSKSLWQEIDFISIYTEVFETLKLPFVIKMNHRKVLQGLTDYYKISEHFSDFTIALDKLDKIGLEGVKKDMQNRGLPSSASEALSFIEGLKGSNDEILAALKVVLESTQSGREAFTELSFILKTAQALDLDSNLELDFTLARGLDYYTGAIFEVKAKDSDLGSIGGGGRYDDLTGIFGLKNMPGIGISFGLDRIQIVLEEKGLLSHLQVSSTDLLLVNFGDKEALFANKLAKKLRAIGVKVELYPDAAKMKKQLDYANKKNIRFVLLIGSKEMEEGLFTLKDMINGSQEKLAAIEILEFFNAEPTLKHG